MGLNPEMSEMRIALLKKQKEQLKKERDAVFKAMIALLKACGGEIRASNKVLENINWKCCEVKREFDQLNDQHIYRLVEK